MLTTGYEFTDNSAVNDRLGERYHHPFGSKVLVVCVKQNADYPVCVGLA
jgi:hypothetical protein